MARWCRFSHTSDSTAISHLLPWKACRDRRDDVLRFPANTSTWPTNNISERGVRPPKTQQKISGRLASDDVTQDRLDIRSYIDTARKHGKNAYAVL